MDTTERVARAICAHESGFCNGFGEYVGCRVGRGEIFDGANCKATTVQLQLSSHWDSAVAAIRAMQIGCRP